MAGGPAPQRSEAPAAGWAVTAPMGSLVAWAGFGVSHGVGGLGQLVGAPEQGAGVAQQGGDRLGGLRCGERVGIGHAPDSDAIAHQCPSSSRPNSYQAVHSRKLATSSAWSSGRLPGVLLTFGDVERRDANGGG
jgi:hypothetical protein